MFDMLPMPKVGHRAAILFVNDIMVVNYIRCQYILPSYSDVGIVKLFSLFSYNFVSYSYDSFADVYCGNFFIRDACDICSVSVWCKILGFGVWCESYL
jgi:hypothetical protein